MKCANEVQRLHIVEIYTGIFFGEKKNVNRLFDEKLDSKAENVYESR